MYIHMYDDYFYDLIAVLKYQEKILVDHNFNIHIMLLPHFSLLMHCLMRLQL